MFENVRYVAKEPAPTPLRKREGLNPSAPPRPAWGRRSSRILSTLVREMAGRPEGGVINVR
jgi:hypothetical protein